MATSKGSGSHRTDTTAPLADTSGEDFAIDWTKVGAADPAEQQLAVPETPDPIKQLLDHARANMMDEDEDTEEVYARMAAQLMAATTADEVFDSQDSTKADTILGIPVWVTEVSIRESDEEFAEGLGYFAVVKGIRSDKRSECAISCGGWSVVMELIRIHMLGELPQMMVFRKKERKTKRGYYPLYISRPM